MAQTYIRRGYLLTPIVLALFAVVVFAWHSPQGRSILASHARPVILVGVLLVLAYAVGMKILRALRIYKNDRFPSYMIRQGEHWMPAPPPDPEAVAHLCYEYFSWEKACFALGLGLGVLAYGTLVLALLQKLTLGWVLAGLALAAFCVPGEIRRLHGYFQLPDDWRARGGNVRKELPPAFLALLAILIAIPVLFGFLSALAPPHQSDALRYHLAAPAVYAQQGGWVYLRDSAFSNFPFTVEMLYALALVFEEDVASRLIHYAFFVLTLLGLYALGRRLHSSAAGLLAAAILANTPFVPILASWAFIEMGLAFYYLLAFYGMVIWMETQLRHGLKKGWLGAYQLEFEPNRLAILTGVFCGLALGVKFTALFLLVYIFLVMVGTWAYRVREEKRQRSQPEERFQRREWLHAPDWRQPLTFAVVAILVASPWYLRNLVVTGNPFFPFLNSIFRSPDWSAFEAAFYHFHAGQKGGLGLLSQMSWLERLSDLVTLPWRATVQHLGNWQISPLYFIYTILLVVFVRRLSRAAKACLWSGLYFFLVWAYTYRDNRFLLPVLILLALAFGVTFAQLGRRPARRLRLPAVVLIIFLVHGCLSMVMNLCVEQYPFAVVAGRQSREDFLASRLDYWRAFQFLNRLPEPLDQAKVLMTGEYRPYYCRRAYIANDWFNTPVLIRYLRETGGIPQLIQRLREEGVKYVLVNNRELAKQGGSYGFYFSFHFLGEADALTFLKDLQQGQFNAERFRTAISASRLSRDYHLFLESGQYLRRIFPADDGEPADIAIYELVE